jgi:cysteine desulfurase / selenocysteine lyase
VKGSATLAAGPIALEEFPLLAAGAAAEPPLVYLDSAATSQKPRAVIDAVSDFYLNTNANVHRGLYDLSRRATDQFESARGTVARFLGAGDPAEVIWCRGTTEAVNLVAASWGDANLRPGDEILLTELEHHSNIVPWQIAARRAGATIRYLEIDEQGRLRLDQLDQLLSERTRIVAVGHVSNALGTINPVAEICSRAHAVGAVVLVDGAQAAPHLPLDVQALGCDFYAISGHKMCGPMGIGALWARRELLEAMPPYQGGGEMIDRVGRDSSTYAALPYKFEAGTPDAAAAIGLAAAIEFLERVGQDRIASHERMLVEYGLSRLAAVPGLRLFGPASPEERIAVFSFDLAGVHPHDVATILDEQRIAIRAGHHCAQLLLNRLDVPATTRASCYLYNSTADLDRLVEGLEVVGSIFA